MHVRFNLPRKYIYAMGVLDNKRTTQLFPVHPIGVGSAVVESLPSYLCRLSVAHGVTVGQMIRYLYETSPWKDHEETPGRCTGEHYINYINELVRPNRLTKFLINELERSTGYNGLVRTTFVPLAGSLDRCQSTFAKYPRWCPACMHECEVSGGPSYYKLIWQIRDVLHCPEHSVALLERCAECGATQGTRSTRTAAHLCQQCGASLSLVTEEARAIDNGTSQSADLVMLLNQYDQIPDEGVSPERIREGLDRYFDWFWENEREEDLYALFGRDRWLSLWSGHSPLTLRTLRQIAYTLGVSIYALIVGELQQKPLALHHEKQYISSPFMRVQRAVRYDRETVLQTVRKIISESEDPLKLVEVARKAGVSKGYLRYRFPVLTSQIAEARRKFELHKSQRAHQQATQAILEYRAQVTEGKAQSGTKKMVDSIQQKHGLSKYLLRKVWKEIRNR